MRTRAEPREPAESRFARLDEACRKRGIPLTVQRRSVFAAVLARSDHPTAEQVFQDIRADVPGISRTTVYRALDTLVEMGLVRKASHLGAAARFDPNTERHHHIVCRKCETVVDLSARALDGLSIPDLRKQGFIVDDYSIHFTGLCTACRVRGGAGGGKKNKRKLASGKTRSHWKGERR
jgi:Fur family peroxide stress response transcriptional regulator